MIKKRHPKFNVPNFGAKKRSGVKERWRKQRGIDNKKRIKMKMMGASPGIGYGNPQQMKNVRASGKRAMIIRNINEFNAFVEKKMSKDFDAVIAHSVSQRLRKQMQDIAKKGSVKIANTGIKAKVDLKETKEVKEGKSNEGVKNEHQTG